VVSDTPEAQQDDAGDDEHRARKTRECHSFRKHCDAERDGQQGVRGGDRDDAGRRTVSKRNVENDQAARRERPARELAHRLGFTIIDTGAIYRAVALAVLWALKTIVW